MATTQAVVGAIKAAGLTMSKIETIKTSQPHPNGEIVTTRKIQTDGFRVVAMPKSSKVVVDFYGADREDRLTKGIAAIRARGIVVHDPKFQGMAVVAE